MKDREAFEAWVLTQGHTPRGLLSTWKAWQAATLAERERCAKVCDYWSKQNHIYVNGALRCEKDIRDTE